MKKINHITTIFLMLLCAASAGAQEGAPSRVYFKTGSAVLDTTWHDNGATLRDFVAGVNSALADDTLTVEAVTVETGASPEGGTQANERLAMDRAKAIRRFLLDNLALNASQVKAYSTGADWEGLVHAVRTSGCPWSEDILKAVASSEVRTNPAAGEKLQKELRSMHGGKAWRWLEENVFPQLRQGAGTMRCIVRREGRTESVRDTLVIVHEYIGPDSESVALAAARESSRRVLESLEKKPKRFRNDSLFRVPAVALRTNALVPLLNAGVEIPLGNRWSIAADWYYPWIWRGLMNRISEPQSQCFQVLGGYIETRRWFGVSHTRGEGRYERYRLTGHSVGLIATGGYYDIEVDREGRQGTFAALGIGYMYALPLGKGDVRLEFEAAVGYCFATYRGYEVHEPGGRLIGNWADGYAHGPVPLKIGVNVMVPIYGKK